ncbi:MAG: TonB-dependent receptor [Hyphomicrobiales bacterium]|nr:TonB-dependent receptor [Hyphomicrobiales bacterium]
MKRLLAGVALSALLPCISHAQDATGAQTGGAVALPEIEVVATAPTGTGTLSDKVPAAVRSLSAADIAKTNGATVANALDRQLSSVSVNSVSGNEYQPDVNYRGFDASPVTGTPQGLAVYQNGVRINEAFGDTVNWELIPTTAIDQTQLISNNPAFGLNALGGAVVLTMKNGFTYQGGEANLLIGSYGRRLASFQFGKQVGNFSLYVASEGINDAGWRDYSRSQLRRFYGDLGYRAEAAEVHFSISGGSSHLGNLGPTPADLLAIRDAAVYTGPQNTHNDAFMANLNGKVDVTDTLKLEGSAYVRSFRQQHNDGNPSQAQPCDPTVNPGLLCFGDAETLLTDPKGNLVPDTLNGGVSGEIDRTHTASLGEGAALQGTSTQSIAGFDNRLVLGVSVDHAVTSFLASGELAVIQPDLTFAGLGPIVDVPAADDAPVSLRDSNTYYGAYVLDALDVTDRLTVTAGGRYNLARITLHDRLGTALNGDNTYARFNPVFGATFKLTPDITVYGGYSEANRAPTPLELGCADPSRPCLIDNFVVSDPHLRQVVSRGFEAGLRGKFTLASLPGRFDWSAGVFRATNANDILNVPSDIIGRGFFENIGRTRRQGAELALKYTDERWSGFARYSFLDATFRSNVRLASPNNPFADANGDIFVHPGDRIPSLPRHKLNIGADYRVTDKFNIGGDVVAASGQFLSGDQVNLLGKVPGYAIANVRASYQVTPNAQVYALVGNAFDTRYKSFGILGNPAAVPFLNLTNPRFFTLGPPLSVQMGVKATF